MSFKDFIEKSLPLHHSNKPKKTAQPKVLKTKIDSGFILTYPPNWGSIRYPRRRDSASSLYWDIP